MPLSVVSYMYIVGPDMTESAYFYSVSGVVKADCYLVMGDFIHHDRACISASIFEAAPFKML